MQEGRLVNTINAMDKLIEETENEIKELEESLNHMDYMQYVFEKDVIALKIKDNKKRLEGLLKNRKDLVEMANIGGTVEHKGKTK